MRRRALRSPADAVRLREIATLARYVAGGPRVAGGPAVAGEPAEAGGPTVAGPGRWLAEHEAKALLRAGGVGVPDGRLVAGEDDAVRRWPTWACDPLKLSSP